MMDEQGSSGDSSVAVTWYGQSMFSFTDGAVTVVVDPFGRGMGYAVPGVSAEVVIMSHNHFDHNKTDTIGGSPVILREPGDHEAAGVKFLGIPSFHDDAGGAERGSNIMFRFELGGVVFAHLGDLGQSTLDESQLEALGGTQFLMVPVGARFTMDGEAAAGVVNEVAPNVAVPMHYGTAADNIGLAPVDGFIAHFPRQSEIRPPTVRLSPAQLPAPTAVWVMEYYGRATISGTGKLIRRASRDE